MSNRQLRLELLHNGNNYTNINMQYWVLEEVLWYRNTAFLKNRGKSNEIIYVKVFTLYHHA